MNRRTSVLAISLPLAVLLTSCGPKGIELRMAVEVVSEPQKASVIFKGKDLGQTPASVTVGTFEELMSIAALQEKGSVIEKRVRILTPDKAQLIFRFGDEPSAVAKKLGLTKVLVFDYSEAVAFDSGKSDLKPDALTILAKQASILNESFPGATVHVCGHTDATGGEDLNLKLSLKRAQVVTDYLVNQKVDATRLKPQGFGKEFPTDTNATPQGRATNRRTELILPQ